jgi:cobalt/nickel transport protein
MKIVEIVLPHVASGKLLERAMRRIVTWITLLLCLLATGGVDAHYHMLLPQAASVRKGEAVAVVYQWGHPFEHQLFDAPAPQRVYALSPNGKRIDLAAALETAEAANGEGKQAHAYRVRFTPEERGDYLLLLETPPIWMEEEQEFWQDTVKTLVHVQIQRGWDRSAGEGFELVPLTRPYGLEPNVAFQAQVLAEGKLLVSSLVEIEHYNPVPPKELPPDEQITRTARTDPNGVVTATLTEPGWWCMTARREAGQREREGKLYPLRRRTTLWVFVNDKAPK